MVTMAATLAATSDSSRRVRVDAARPVRLGATPIEVRPDGYKVYRGVATYGDVVLDYPEFNPPRAEFRPAAEVLSPEAVASMVGVPFTLHHPDDLLDADDPESIRRHQVGTVLRAVADLREDPPALRVDVIVHSKPAQDAVESGKLADLSPGYRCKDEAASPGAAHAGRRYGVVQRGHRYNHLSGVLSARTVTPDGRRARLDEDPGAAFLIGNMDLTNASPSYPHTGTATMADDATSNTHADKPTPPTDPPVRRDADPTAALAMFSPEDATILKTLSPAGLATLAALGVVAAGEAAEQAAVGDPAAVPVAEIEEEDAAPPPAAAGATMDEATVKKMIADAIATAMSAAPGKKTDAATPANPAAPATAEAVVVGDAAKAERARLVAAAAEEARRVVRADAAIVAAVRKDGHEVAEHDVDAAVKTMLVVIEKNAPRLIARAREDYKAGRMDHLRAAYETAEDARRAAKLDAQAGALASVFAADDASRARNPGVPNVDFRLPSPR